MLTSIFTIVLLVSAIAIVVLVLLQQGRGADAGAAFGGGSSQSLFGSRGSANFLSKSTALLAVVFFASALALAMISTRRADVGSVAESVTAPTGEEVPAAPNEVPGAPDGNRSGQADSSSSTSGARSADTGSGGAQSDSGQPGGAGNAGSGGVPSVPPEDSGQ